MLELGIAPATTDILAVGSAEDYKILPSWSDLSLSAEPGRPSVLTFTYPRNGVRAGMIHSGARVRVTFPYTLSGSLFEDVIRVEPPNMVFVVGEIGYNEETSNDQTMSVSLQSTLQSMSNLLLAPAMGSTHLDEEIFDFKNQSVGQLVREAASVALSRSPHTHLVLGFDDQYDSLGLPWGNPIDSKFSSGQSFAEVLEWLVSLGFAYPSFGRHKKWIPSQDPEALTADLVLDRDSTEYALQLYSVPLQGFGYRTYYLSERYEMTVTRQEEFTNIVNQVFVTGDENICGWASREDSVFAYGVREGKWAVSNAARHETILAAAERYLDIYAYPRISQTLDIEFPPDGVILFYFPSFVFGKSDDTHSIEMLSLRVSSANHNATITVTIDNYFDRRKTLLDQRLARLGLSR